MVGYYVEYSGLRMGCEGWDGDATILNDLAGRVYGFVKAGGGSFSGEAAGGFIGSGGKGFGYCRLVSGSGVQTEVVQPGHGLSDGLRRGKIDVNVTSSCDRDAPGLGVDSFGEDVPACERRAGDKVCNESSEGRTDRATCNTGQPASDGGPSTLKTEFENDVGNDIKGNGKEKGKWYASNKRKREGRKANGSRTKGESSGAQAACAVPDPLRASLESKWKMQNELAAEEARRKLEILKANDIQDEVRRRATQVKRHTESNMVAIEKTHKFLSATGNVAGEPAGGQGFAETIIGESISPDSSASMQEFRAAQKKILDQQQEIEKLKKAYKKAGGNPEAIDLYDKSLFTMEDGTIAQHYVDRFADLNLTWGFPENAIEYRNGKKKTRVDFYGVKDEDGDDFGNIYGDC